MRLYKKQKKKGAISTFDLIFAIITVLLIFYFGMLLISQISNSISFQRENFEGKTRAYILSSMLIKREMAYTDHPLVYSHLIEKEIPDPSKYLNKFNVSTLSIALISKTKKEAKSTGNFSSGNVFCSRRIVFIKGEGVGIVETCIQ